jgi:seryl-tRNA synthetase
MPLAALQSRAATAEKLLAEAKEQYQAERNALNMPLAPLQSRAATAEKLLAEAKEQHQAERNALVERTSALTETLKTRETSRARAEEKIRSLTERIALLESQMETNRQVNENEKAALQRAMAKGAREATRRDNPPLPDFLKPTAHAKQRARIIPVYPIG